MLHTLIHWVVSALSLVLTAYLVPGFQVDTFGRALIASVVIGIANIVIWPILMFLALPLNILTLGLFTFVINAIVLRLCAGMLKGFRINGWGSAILGAVILACVGTLMHYLLVPQGV